MGAFAILNHVDIMGRLVRAPELRRTQNDIAVCSFTLAVERDFRSGEERETDFIDCVAWRAAAEFLQRYFSKGSMCIVSGRMQTRAWTDRDGNKRKAVEVVAENIYFGESKRTAMNADAEPELGGQYSELEPPDGELPF